MKNRLRDMMSKGLANPEYSRPSSHDSFESIDFNERNKTVMDVRDQYDSSSLFNYLKVNPTN